MNDKLLMRKSSKRVMAFHCVAVSRMAAYKAEQICRMLVIFTILAFAAVHIAFSLTVLWSPFAPPAFWSETANIGGCALLLTIHLSGAESRARRAAFALRVASAALLGSGAFGLLA